VSTLLLAAAAAKRTIIHSSLNDVFSVIRALAAAAAAADDNDKPLSLCLSLYEESALSICLYSSARITFMRIHVQDSMNGRKQLNFSTIDGIGPTSRIIMSMGGDPVGIRASRPTENM